MSAGTTTRPSAAWTPLAGVVGGIGGWGISCELSTTTLPGSGPVVSKSPHAHTRHIPGSARVEAARMAASLGLGPEVIDADPSSGTVVQRLLADPWQTGTLGRLAAYGAVPSLLAARTAFRTSGLVLPPRDLVADVRELLAAARRSGYRPVDEVARLFDLIGPISAAVADGPAPQPSWGTGEVSNVMVEPSGRVMLVGGTFAGQIDPLADVGATLTDLCPALADDEELFVACWGGTHPGALARARLYGVLDDLRCGLLAALGQLVSAGAHDDYWTYHNLRMRRAAFTVYGCGRFESWLCDARLGWE